MLPRLRAEEALHRVLEVSVGTGAVAKTERRKIMNEWLRLADHRKPRGRLSLEQQKFMLAAMGIKLECRNN